MPRYAVGIPGQMTVMPTFDEEMLIRGIGFQDRMQWTAGGPVRSTNIAAVHFDGQLLMDMVAAHKELETRNRQAQA